LKENQKLRAVIVDDESRSHQHLTSLFDKNHPEVELLGSAFSVEDGLKLINLQEPNLVFLDIEMPDGTGFDLLHQIENYNFKVIFITGHNKYAVTAIKFGAIDYLLKPVDEKELAIALKEAQKEAQKQAQLNMSQEQLAILWETLERFNQQKLPSRIAIATTEGIHYKQVKDVIRLEAKQSYTEFSFENDKKIIASSNLGEFIEQFEHYSDFMKVHRSHLVNLNFVKTFVKTEGGHLVMVDDSEVSVSRLYKDDLLERLKKL